MDLFGSAPRTRHVVATTLDEALFTWYAGATGDFHPAHSHRAQADSGPLGGRTAPAPLLCGLAEALVREVVGPAVAVVAVEATWVARARLGETVETTLVLESGTRARVSWKVGERDLGAASLTLTGAEA